MDDTGILVWVSSLVWIQGNVVDKELARQDSHQYARTRTENEIKA